MAQNYVEILVGARDEAKPDLEALKAKLEELSHKVATARAEVDDTDAAAKLDRMQAKLLDLDKKTANPNIKMAGALRAEADIHAVEAAMDGLSRKSDEINAKAGSQGLMDRIVNGASGASGKGPALLGPILALTPAIATLGGVAAGAAAGIGGAFVAGAGALAAFGSVAKPVLTDAQKASQAVQKAQDNYTIAIEHGTSQAKAYKAEQVAIAKAYADMSPQQIALSKQLGAMSDAWDKVKASMTPVVSGALQPWLGAVTDVMGQLAPIITRVSGVIGELGTQFRALIDSSSFTTFRDFIANTGSQAVNAAGSTLISFFQAFIDLLPKFNPLIQEAIRWLSGLGPAVETWASSQKTADGITKFMDWFNTNGPVVSGLLKNVGEALKTLAPGLAQGGITELGVISDFLGLIARLPKGLAGPLMEVAGALLLLNKLGIIKVGLQVIGPLAKWLSGGAINIGGTTAAAEMEAAMRNGGAAAAAEIRAAMTGGGGTGAAEAGAAGGASGLMSKLKGFLAPVGAAMGPMMAGIMGGALIKAIGDTLSPAGSFAGTLNSQLQKIAGTSGGIFSTTLLHSFTFGGLEAKLTTGIGMPVGNVLNNIGAGAKLFASSIGQTFSGAWNTLGAGAKLFASSTGATLSNAWSAFLNGAKLFVSNVVNEFTQLPGKILHAVASFGSLLVNAGRSLLTGLVSGIESMVGSVISAVVNVGSSILSSIKGALGIASPSKVFHEIGENVGQGLINGIASKTGPLRAQALGMASAVTGGMGALGAAGGGGAIQLQVTSGGSSAFEQFMVQALRNYVRVRGGNVQAAIGH